MSESKCPACASVLQSYDSGFGNCLVCLDCQEWFDHPCETDKVCIVCKAVLDIVVVQDEIIYVCKTCKLSSMDQEMFHMAYLLGFNITRLGDEQYLLKG